MVEHFHDCRTPLGRYASPPQIKPYDPRSATRAHPTNPDTRGSILRENFPVKFIGRHAQTKLRVTPRGRDRYPWQSSRQRYRRIRFSPSGERQHKVNDQSNAQPGFAEATKQSGARVTKHRRIKILIPPAGLTSTGRFLGLNSVFLPERTRQKIRD